MILAFLRRLGRAAYDLRRVIVVACALTGMLVRPGALEFSIAPLAFGIPLAVTAFQPRESRAFRLWALYIGAFLSFWVFRNMADDVGVPVQFVYPIAFDRWLVGGVPSVIMQSHWYHGTLGALEWLAIGTYYSYFVIPPLSLVLIWLKMPEDFPRYVVASVLMFMGAVIVHVLVPTAPPWLAAHDGYLPPVTQLIYRALQIAIPATVHYGSDMIAGNYVAAMPSVHMGVTSLLALVAWHARRWAFVLAVGYATLMAFAIMYTGDHYAADAIGGVVTAWLSWKLAPRFWTGGRGQVRKDAAGVLPDELARPVRV